MYAWGSTINGELGLGGIEDEYIHTPRLLEWHGVDKIKEVACGEHHTLILLKDGKVYSCGNNDYGQLGHGHPRKRPRMSIFSMCRSDLFSRSDLSIRCFEVHYIYLEKSLHILL